MKHPRLLAELLWLRYGASPLIALACAAAGAWLHFAALPALAADGERQRRVLAVLEHEARNPPPSPTALLDRRYREFSAHLARREALPEIVRTIFIAARQQGLVPQQMEYRLAPPAAGGFVVYRIDAPLAGSYAAVRRFAQDVLEQVPAAALEEAAFKRAAIGSTETEAKLRFAIYLKEES